jgi:hypothetical protein
MLRTITFTSVSHPLSTGIFFFPSRVVALFGGRPQILAPLSTSETVIGVRSWSDFALSANRGERVSDAFGAAERLLLTASSSICARTSPSIAIFDPAHRNEGLLDPSNTASGGAAFLGASERFPVCPCEPDWANQIGTFPRLRLDNGMLRGIKEKCQENLLSANVQ